MRCDDPPASVDLHGAPVAMVSAPPSEPAPAVAVLRALPRQAARRGHDGYASPDVIDTLVFWGTL